MSQWGCRDTIALASLIVAIVAFFTPEIRCFFGVGSCPPPDPPPDPPPIDTPLNPRSSSNGVKLGITYICEIEGVGSRVIPNISGSFSKGFDCYVPLSAKRCEYKNYISKNQWYECGKFPCISKTEGDSFCGYQMDEYGEIVEDKNSEKKYRIFSSDTKFRFY